MKISATERISAAPIKSALFAASPKSTILSPSTVRTKPRRVMRAIECESKRIVIALSIGALGLTTTVSEADPSMRQQLEMLQRQLEQQRRMLQEMQLQLDEQKAANEQRLREEARIKEEAEKAKRTAQEAEKESREERRAMANRGERETVVSGQERVKLSISGQVNRAVNIADDGEDTKAYFVDNDASNTRYRFIGTAKTNDDLTIGSRIELAIAPDESGTVSQDNESPGDFFDQRWAEVSLTSKRFGKVSVGKGDTASNNSAEVDLSRTDVVQYASIAAIAGGLQFRDSNGMLSGIRVSDAFQDEDGLSRQSRLRYDTPTWRGFYLATSAVSDQRWDASLWWAGKGYGIKAAGAFAVADPNEDDSDLRYDSSFSALHEHTGFNFTLSGGLLESGSGGDATNFYTKLGWLPRFFSVGKTAFGVDYTRSVNIPTNSHDGYSVSLAVVQEFEKFGTELYSQVRKYSLSNDGVPSAQDITVGTFGGRVKF